MRYLITFCFLFLGFAQTSFAQLDLGVEDEMSVTADTQDSDTSNGDSMFGSLFKIFSTSETSSNEEGQEAIEVSIEKAKNNDVEALLTMGYNYLYGANGTPVDYKQAFAYYEKAAEQNNAIAINNLGSLYFNGIGVDVDYEKAVELFQQAAKLGSNDAAFNLAIIYLGTDTEETTEELLAEVLPLLQQASSSSDGAKFLLGYAYYKGFMVKNNSKKAFQLVKKAADAGYDEAQLLLADFYINGVGTPRNYTRAVQYLRSAIEQGHPLAFMTLAQILEQGKIYQADIKEAYYLYNLASVLGVKGAAKKRDLLESYLKIEDLLDMQRKGEDYSAYPSQLTTFIRKTFGKSLKIYIDRNIKK